MIPLRLILDVVFCGISIISFYMWAYLNEKYRNVKYENEKLRSKITISENNEILKQE